MGSKNNNEAPPPYFAQFLERFDRRMDGVDNSIQQLDAKMSERVDRIEGQLMNIQQDLKRVVQNNALIDSAEILISGLPKQLNMSRNDIISCLFTALEIPHLTNFIISVREWTGPDLSFRKSAENNLTNHNSGTPPAPAANPNFYSLVIKLVSPSVRDEVVSKTPKLKDKTIQNLFDTPGNSQVFCRALWPREVYSLYKKAFAAAKNLNSEKPLIRNLIVCMRETRNSPLLPLSSESDLSKLAPRQAVSE
ncbi:hypothetical protein QAD02_001904 [Eretmocerus hayati]|uniref:Uncharacterized protein n=1 Tax=Eretmocerus hayati TaxID=131215 RepID=A0ACC2NHF7_9HYME|nr:hypothetical protein QAD02_001904 [Eretmocerus hayati]